MPATAAAVIPNFFQASCDDAFVTVCASVVIVREHLDSKAGDKNGGDSCNAFLNVPRPALEFKLVESGCTLDRTATWNRLRPNAGLRVEGRMDNMIVKMPSNE